ncbi:hypothetical protein CFBP6626_07535 [Agrobacterium tumefaciens]|nr:hypothetical protein CFBP6626_07535 [Agrobacterium tumefaciens]
MSEHSIEELERQVQSARGKAEQWCKAYEEAKERLHEAKCAKTGMIGKTISHKDLSIVVHDIYFLSGEPWRYSGFALKKDGTVGRQERTIYHSSIAKEFERP